MVKVNFSVNFICFRLHSRRQMSRPVRVVIATPGLERLFAVEKYQLQRHFLNEKRHKSQHESCNASLNHTRKTVFCYFYFKSKRLQVKRNESVPGFDE